jgi:Ca-activated chloride channel homolog
MTFDRAWILFFLVLALAEPSIVIRERKVALAVLVDTSASVTDSDLSRESALVKQINSARGSNQINVIPFARAPRSLDEKESDFNFGHTSGLEGRGTNLEAPIRQALASLPAGMLHRIALITDGNENDGAVTRAAWQAQQNGVAIDTIALAGREQPQLKTEAVGIPGKPGPHPDQPQCGGRDRSQRQDRRYGFG